MPKKEEAIHARALLVTVSGKNILEEQPVTAADAEAYRVAAATVSGAEKALAALGFSVEKNSGDNTLGISGSKKLFEKSFGTKLKNETTKETTYYKPAGPVTIPASLQQYITAIVFAEPAEYFY